MLNLFKICLFAIIILAWAFAVSWFALKIGVPRQWAAAYTFPANVIFAYHVFVKPKRWMHLHF